MATGPANYSYFGNPISQGFASQTAQAHLAAQGQIGAANAQAAGNANAARNNHARSANSRLRNRGLPNPLNAETVADMEMRPKRR
jgi:hypothetical protein